ncbi:MAG: hypothetical protein ACD_33C00041G0005 [uncultured bacterium]|nr:MAG: hypothetical protein ACD_33C00041G0005 [uncultured bacterium]
MLTRNKSYIESNLYIKDGKIYTKKKAFIEFPKYYENKELLTIETNIFLYGVFAIIIDDKYSVSTIPTMLQTNPVIIEEFIKDDVEFIRFIYGKDSVIIDNTSIVRNKILSYKIFESFYVNGNVPWYIEYEDLVKILDNMPHYADSNIGSSHIANEVICSFITRVKENKTIFHRLDAKKEYSYVDLTNIYYSAISTLNKCAGSYFSDGLVSAIVQKEVKPTKLENLVRL